MINVIRKFIWVFLLGLFLFFVTTIRANHIPGPTGFINDFAGVLTSEQRSALENSLKDYEQKTTNEITVALVTSLNSGEIDDFTIRTFEEWKVGKEGKDNGILFLASVEDRKMRIEVGYGLEPYLTDGEAGEIIRNVVAPKFRQQDYYGGITDALSAIQNQLENSDLSSSPTSIFKKFWDNIELIPGILIFIWVLGSFIVYISSYLARSKSIWLGGIMGAVLGAIIGLVTLSLLISIASIVILGLLGLLLDWILSRVYRNLKKAGHRTDWWHTGGGFWGGRGSGGGFGGFGGGRSGGGGASGGW